MTTIANHYGLEYERIAAAVVGVIAETATEIEQDIKGKGPHEAPFRTGNLRRSYHQDRSRLKDPLVPEIDIGNDPGIADYAIYVEFGTSRAAAQPHLTPATEAQRGPHTMRLAAAISEASGKGALGGFAAPVSAVSGLGASSSDYLTDY